MGADSVGQLSALPRPAAHARSPKQHPAGRRRSAGGNGGPNASDRVRVAVLVRRADALAAKPLIEERGPMLEPISDQELARQTDEGGTVWLWVARRERGALKHDSGA
jgi:hypothetical protein